jgi:hypothetical protein
VISHSYRKREGQSTYGVLGRIDTLELDLSECLDDSLVRCDVWEGDNISNLMHLNDKIKGLMKIQAPPPPPVLTPAPFLLCLTTPITDSNGVQIGVFGDIMDKLGTLKANNVRLSDHLDAIKADLTNQGGIVFGQHTFTSELQVLQVAMSECPQGDAFGLFVDPILLFCHDAMYSPCSSWQKDMKAMEELGFMSISDRKVVASYDLNTPWWFSKDKQVTGGKVIGTFAMAEKWQGMGGMIGRREEIKNSAEVAGDCVRQATGDKLPGGGKLAQLAIRMMEHTQSWFQKVHKHLDSELTKLNQMGILQEHTLVLLLEEVLIMFERLYLIRRKRMDFTVKDSRVKYMVRCIWLILKVHVQMDEFVCDGLKYNLAVLAAFVQFLTSQTRSNGDAGFDGQLAKLEERLKSAENAIKEAVKEAKEASKCAALAGTSADSVRTGLTKLYANNSTLKT